MADKIIIHRNVTEYPDSIEIGTPGKEGRNVKVYFNASNLDETRMRIDNAITARNYLEDRYQGRLPARKEVPSNG
jgi:hypothetical protein